jgi:hypothetical protein
MALLINDPYRIPCVKIGWHPWFPMSSCLNHQLGLFLIVFRDSGFGVRPTIITTLTITSVTSRNELLYRSAHVLLSC